MSLMKLNHGEGLMGMNSMFDDLFSKNFFSRDFYTKSTPPVNVNELEKEFEIEMAIPGYKKEDFNIDLESGNILTISASREEEIENNEKKVTRREYNYSSFSRSFTLPKSVDTETIDASYDSGILKIKIQKLALAENKEHKKIEIH